MSEVRRWVFMEIVNEPSDDSAEWIQGSEHDAVVVGLKEERDHAIERLNEVKDDRDKCRLASSMHANDSISLRTQVWEQNEKIATLKKRQLAPLQMTESEVQEMCDRYNADISRLNGELDGLRLTVACVKEAGLQFRVRVEELERAMRSAIEDLYDPDLSVVASNTLEAALGDASEEE